MWVMFLIVMARPTSGYADASIFVTQSEFSSKEACVAAVNFSNKR